MSCIYHQAASNHLDEALSPERFQRYISWAGGNEEDAFHLYALNTQLSEALYTPLQMLEITLRNRFHAILSNRYGEGWFDIPGLLQSPDHQKRLTKARSDLEKENKQISSGGIVSVLTFGFWTGLLSPVYEPLWQQTLHQATRNVDGKGLTRKALSARLTPIRILRNRIAHHEPILAWNLPRHYQAILQVTEWLSPVAYNWSKFHSRFEQVYPAKDIILK